MGLLAELRSYTRGPYNLATMQHGLWGDPVSPPTRSGVYVTESTALNFSAVWAAVSIISADIASLPLVLYKVSDEGKTKTRFISNPLYKLLHDAPNPEMSSMVFRETLQAHVLTWGNGYAEIERNGADKPVALWPITPDRMTVERPNGQLRYRVKNGGGRMDTVLAPRDVLHVPGLGFDGVQGYSVVGMARESISLGLATEQFGSTFFGNGSTFGGVLAFKNQRLDKEFKQGVRESIDKMHSGVDRAHKFLILGGDVEYSKISVPPNDAQFLETRRFQITEIARWFLVPPHKLGDLERATFSNIEQQDIEYYKSGLRRWLVRWEQELNRKLVPPLEQNSQKFEHNVEGLLRGDSQARAEFYSKMFTIGAYSINMILEKENANPIGPDGDIHFVPVNMAPAEIAAKGPTPAPAPLPPPNDSGQMDGQPTDPAMRSLLEQMAATTTAIHTSLEAERSAVTQAERDAHTAERTRLEQEGARLQTALLEIQATADRLQIDMQTEVANAQAERQAREAAEAAQAAAERERGAALESYRAAQVAQETAEAERQVAEQRFAEAMAQVDVLAAEKDADRQAHTEVRDTATAALEASMAALETAERRQAEAETARTVAETRLQASLGETDMARQAQRQADAAAEAVKTAERKRMVDVIAAHRALMVDSVGRMIQWETDKARRNQATPEKFRRWLEPFYTDHAHRCQSALLPVMRTHLAWQQSDQDPVSATTDLVRRHIAQSLAELQAVLHEDCDDFATALESTLRRWETTRADAMADAILHAEVSYVQRA